MLNLKVFIRIWLNQRIWHALVGIKNMSKKLWPHYYTRRKDYLLRRI